MKGILTNEQEKFFADVIDEAIKGKGFIEMVDGYAAKVMITLVDDQFVDKLPEDLKVDLSALASAGIDGDLEVCEELVTSIINKRVDIPGIDEDAEAMIFSGAVNIIVGAIKKWIEKRKA